MKLPSVQSPAPVQDPIDPLLTLALAQASAAAYADFEGKCYKSPANYRPIARWTGWDEIFPGVGAEERYGLLFQCMLPGQTRTFIFAFRGTDSDLDAFEDPFFNTVPFTPYSGIILPTPYVSSGFFGIYTGIGGDMTKSMQQQVFSLLNLVKPEKIYITGHSLGGALSQLFTLDVAISVPGLWAANMNFASPMVGTAEWQTAYDSQPAQKNPLTRTVRVYNYWDYVPSTPPTWFNYTHVGRPFRTSFYVIGAWFPYLLARHSLSNLQTVLQQAVWLNPQIWVGTFTDASGSGLPMASTVPPSAADVPWIDKLNELNKFEQNILEGGKVTESAA